MDPAPAAQTPAAAETPVPTGTGSGQEPVGYKLVKVRKADGTLVTVRRKISPDEEGTTSAPAQSVPANSGASQASGTTPQFKIVTVRKADGTLVKVRRPIAKPSEAGENEKAAPKTTDPQKVEASTTVAEPKSTVDTSPPTVVPSVLKTTKSNTGAAKPADDAKESYAVVPSTVDADKPRANDGSSEPQIAERDLANALAEQAIYHRQKRTHRFKSSLMRGFGMAVGSALPSLELSHDFEDGDELLSDDDDYSVDDGDEDDHDHDDGGHDISDELHTSNGSDHGAVHEADNSASGTHVTFDASGALGKVAAGAAANAAAKPQPPPPPPPGAQAAARAAQNGGSTNSDSEKEKHTYKITAKELADIEQVAAENVTEKKLNRHWANLTFYFMASLSIILPSLFLLLAGFIGGMKGKLETSSWRKMEDAIKVAISAWPIVFAAVVAQCFKAYATFKVERGIRLMELEQLVGSSSFASAMKQPILLRRLDLLTLALFGIWCLSPLGSQALQRVYSLDRHEVPGTADIKLVPTYGRNRLFDSANGSIFRNSLEGDREYSELLQLASSYYIAALTPHPEEEKYTSDRYAHPIMINSQDYNVQAYGAFVTYPNTSLTLDGLSDFDPTKAEKALPKYEEMHFNLTYSYFNFTCGNWQNKTVGEMDNATDYVMMYSDSWTMGMSFTGNQSITRLVFASANNAVKQAKNSTAPWQDDNYPFSFIECGLEQVFEEAEVNCTTDLTTAIPDCWASAGTPLPPDRTKGKETHFGDFLMDFLASGNPGVLVDSPATISELYLYNGWNVGGDTFESDGLVMSAIPVDLFQTSLSFLFNTIMGLGYCPECVEVIDPDEAASRTDVAGLYTTIQAQRITANDLVYVINAGWLAGFTVCAAILFLAGLAAVAVESMTVAPDVLGYVSTVARNSRYLQLPKTSGAMSGGERAKTVGSVKVMMQDVKGNANVGKIALGLKHDKAQRLVTGRLYR